MIDVTLKIQRFNPETDKAPYWAEYKISVDPVDRVLDALILVKQSIDGTLTFRRSCAHGGCGSDAMLINGRNQLACRLLVKNCIDTNNATALITIAPGKGMRVIKDLVIDMEGFFDKFKKGKPYLIANDDPGQQERLQSPQQREVFDDTTKCIMCAACTTSCPTFWLNEDYLGPQAMVMANRFLFDSRDQASAERLDILGESPSAFTCRTFANCLDACPRDINIIKAIAQIRQLLVKHISGGDEVKTRS